MKMAAQSAADVASSAARADGASVEDAGGNGSAGSVTKTRNPKQPEATPQQRSKSGKFKKNKQENKSIPSINFNIDPQD